MPILLLEMRLWVIFMKGRIGTWARSGKGFSLYELMIVLLIISIIVSVSALVMMKPTENAERTVAKANDRIGYTIMQSAWLRIVGNGGDRYLDPKPPEGFSAPADVDAEYLSKIEPRVEFWQVKREGNRFVIAGIYKDGQLIPGTGTWDNPVTDWNLIYRMIGISSQHYWDPGSESYKRNNAGQPASRYLHLMTLVVTKKGYTYWATYRTGNLLKSGTFRDPGWDDGRGSP